MRLLHFLHTVTVSQFPDESTVHALDWGCGKGHISLLLREHGFDVTSCDLAGGEPDSSFGQATPLLSGIEQEVVPLTEPVALPFADESFHVATSFGVLEHVSDDAASLRELFRVLRPNGLLFITFLPSRTSYVQRLAHLRGNRYHDRLYSRRGLREAAREAGFHVVSISRAQLFPKNRLPHIALVEALDRALCATPAGLIATNLEAVLVKPRLAGPNSPVPSRDGRTATTATPTVG